MKFAPTRSAFAFVSTCLLAQQEFGCVQGALSTLRASAVSSSSDAQQKRSLASASEATKKDSGGGEEEEEKEEEEERQLRYFEYNAYNPYYTHKTSKYGLVLSPQRYHPSISQGDRYQYQPTTTAVFVPSLSDIICAPENANLLGTFCTALGITGLLPLFDVYGYGGNLRRHKRRTLQDRNSNVPYQQYTVFGPTNDAFRKLGEDNLEYLLRTERGRVDLSFILLEHVLDGRRLDFQQLGCGQSYTMLNEQPTTGLCRGASDDSSNGITRKFLVGTGNGNTVDDWAELIDFNAYARNGVLHVVNRVVIPYMVDFPIGAPTIVDPELERPQCVFDGDCAFLNTNIGFSRFFCNGYGRCEFSPIVTTRTVVRVFAVPTEVWTVQDFREVVRVETYRILRENRRMLSGVRALEIDVNGIEVRAVQYDASDSVCRSLFKINQLLDVESCYDTEIIIIDGPSVDDDENEAAEIVVKALNDGKYKNAIRSVRDATLFDLFETLIEQGYTILVDALLKADLVEDLLFPNEPFTVMAPTNEVFESLDDDYDLPGLFECLIEPRYIEVLQDILMYHVARGQFLTKQLFNDQKIEMVNEESILINVEDNVVVINDNSPILQSNMIATNGIAHGIEGLLLPPLFNVDKLLDDCIGTTDEPTEEPTEEPTPTKNCMRSVTFNYTGFSCNSNQRTAHSTPRSYNDPTFRWYKFSTLTPEQLTATEKLGYTEDTWNMLNTNAIEYEKTFDSLSDEEAAAAIQLGFDEESWDCDHNHYYGYNWSGSESLQTYDYARYWIVLGYSESSWEDDDFRPDSFELDWTQLSHEQQVAAWELCYFQESWDETSMMEWTTFGVRPPKPTLTPVPTNSPVTIEPSRSPSRIPTNMPTASSPVSPVGFCEDDDDEGLPNGIRYELYTCTENANDEKMISERSRVYFKNESVEVIRDDQQCLPDCVQVRLFDTANTNRDRVQRFNIEPKCEPNITLKYGTNYGAFQYLEHQCGELTTPAPVSIPSPEPTDPPTPPPSLIPSSKPTKPPTNEESLLIPDLLNSEGFTTFAIALEAADLINTLQDAGPFTVFAPTNEAFVILGDEYLGCLLEPRFIEQLNRIMFYHITLGKVLTEQLSNGQEIVMTWPETVLITIEDDNTIVLNADSEVVKSNMMARNGVLHGIDRALKPPGFIAEAFLFDCRSLRLSLRQSLQSASGLIVIMEKALSDNPGIDLPELALLKDSLTDPDPNSTVVDIMKLVYKLMIKRVMLYDEDTDTGALTSTRFTDLPNNLENPEVKQRFVYLYNYGMALLQQKILDSDTVNVIMVSDLISLTELKPEKFRTWLFPDFPSSAPTPGGSPDVPSDSSCDQIKNEAVCNDDTQCSWIDGLSLCL